MWVLPIDAHTRCQGVMLPGKYGPKIWISRKGSDRGQLAIKNPNSNSWTVMVRNVLLKYELPDAYKVLSNTPAKSQWKRCVGKCVPNYWNHEHIYVTKMSCDGKESITLHTEAGKHTLSMYDEMAKKRRGSSETDTWPTPHHHCNTRYCQCTEGVKSSVLQTTPSMKYPNGIGVQI